MVAISSVLGSVFGRKSSSPPKAVEAPPARVRFENLRICVTIFDTQTRETLHLSVRHGMASILVDGEDGPLLLFGMQVSKTFHHPLGAVNIAPSEEVAVRLACMIASEPVVVEVQDDGGFGKVVVTRRPERPTLHISSGIPGDY